MQKNLCRIICLFVPLTLVSAPLLEVKAGYFFFTDSTMSDVYDQGGIDVQIAGSYPIYKCLHLYGSVEYMQKSGHSLGGNEPTSIWQLPLSLGIKPVFVIHPSISYYFSVGPRYFFTYVDNNSPYVPQEINSNGIGCFVNTGFLFLIGQHFTVDLFGEYSYCKLSFTSPTPATEGQNTQVGGLTFGAGLGWTF